MSNKFAENVKRIVGEERDTTTPPELLSQDGIDSVRGIGTQTAGGKVTSQTGGTGTSAKSDNKDGKTDNTTEEQSKESTSPNPNDQNSFQKNPTSGEFDAEDLIDGTDGPALKDAALDIFAGDSFASSSLSGINALDCATGNELNIRVDGLYKPLDATTWDDGTPKTPSWPDPTVAPETPGFNSGTLWTPNVPGADDMATRYDMTVISAAITLQNRGPLISGGGGPGSRFGPNSFSQYYRFLSYDEISSTQSNVIMEETDSGGTPIGPSFTAFDVNSSSCTPGSSAACPSSPPVETSWPEDDTISLTREDSKFQASSFDTDATPTYSGQNSSHINFCMDGGRFGTIRVGRDGGNVVYETDGANGPPLPGSVVRYYAADGSLAGFGDTTSLNSFLPRTDD